jgi:hypothetical protein
MQKEPTAQTAHLVLLTHKANTEKPKEPDFLPELGRTNKETNE